VSGTISMAYLLAGVLFIRSLGGLSRQETAREGNLAGLLGMALAVVVTIVVWFSQGAQLPAMTMLLGAAAVGSVVGATLARRVEMTGMPELVAMLHSFVGLAAVLVGVSSYLQPAHDPAHGLVGGAAAARVRCTRWKSGSASRSARSP
jgi:NAD(P) transhydrogenase subunit beta